MVDGVMLGAKMMYHLDPSTQGKCVTMATNLSPDLDQRTVAVTLPLCVFVWLTDVHAFCHLVKHILMLCSVMNECDNT